MSVIRKLATIQPALVLVALVLVAPRARAEEKPGTLPSYLSNASAVFSVPAEPKPLYLVPWVDPTFSSTLQRITPDPGTSTAPVSGTWGSDTRHVYSKQQPWSSDASLYILENRSGGSPTPLVLDGKTYAPRYSMSSSAGLYDYRWLPSTAHPHELVNVNSSGTELSWVDVTTSTKTRTWTLPITADYGIGSGEGNPSRDGRFVCVGNASSMVVVDMDPQPPYAPYPNRRIGPVYTFAACSLLVSSPTSCAIGNLSVSASGKYVDVKYQGTTGDTYDAHRIFEVDPATLALKPHAMAQGSLRCDSFTGRANGWIFALKHADMTLDPFDGNEDVIVGGRACPGSTLGHVVKVRLRDGATTGLTDPSNEASVYHVSTRSYNRLGWAYVSFYKVAGTRFSDEIIAVKLDGSRTVERYAHIHSAASGCYRCEAHPSPSPDGSRIAFASNWAQDCGSNCGSSSVIKDYVIAGPLPSAGVPGRPAGDGLALSSIWPNPGRSPMRVSYVLPGSMPARFELVDVAGRIVLAQEIDAPSRGAREATVAFDPRVHPGTYWLRLAQSGQQAVSRVVLLR